TVLAEPCSPDIPSMGYGPPARSVANTQATTSTKSFRLDRLRKDASSSMEPPLWGMASGSMPAASAKAHGWRSDGAPAVGSDFDRAPALIGEIEIDVPAVLRDTNVDRPLGAIKLSLRLKQIERRPDCRGGRRRARSFSNGSALPRC